MLPLEQSERFLWTACPMGGGFGFDFLGRYWI